MIHDHGYWLEVSGPNVHVMDEKLAAALVRMFDGMTIVDVGCGDGAYTKNFLDNGIDCTGYDGSPLTPELSNNLCHVKDFAKRVEIGKYDVVLSLEVGEHIPEKFEQIFLDNLCHSSGQWICLSWAVEGQPGYGHVNCKNNDYIISEMRKRGFKFREEWTNFLRENSSLPWFENTIMVFEDDKES